MGGGWLLDRHLARWSPRRPENGPHQPPAEPLASSPSAVRSLPVVPPVARVLRTFGMFADPDPAAVDQICATGLGLSIGPYFVQRTASDDNLGDLNLGSPRPYIEQMRRARALGMRTTLKPMVDVARSEVGAGWRGTVDPPAVSSWFTDYWQRGIEPYLEWSDSLIVQTELTKASSAHPQEWSELVVRIRDAGFVGPVISDADLTVDTTPWFGVLDWLGGSFYPSIDVRDDTSALRDWAVVNDQIVEASRRTGLPVFMSEVGAPSLSDVELIRWLKTMLAVLGPNPNWAGFSYWRWPQDPRNTFSRAVLETFAGVSRAGRYPADSDSIRTPP